MTTKTILNKQRLAQNNILRQNKLNKKILEYKQYLNMKITFIAIKYERHPSTKQN